MTKFQKRVKQIVASEYPAQTVCKRDGTVQTKKGYFDPPGPGNYTAKGWGADILKALEKAGLKVTIATWYLPAPFPKMSYLVAALKENR